MDSKAVWDLLANIPLSTVVTWIALISAVVSAVWFAIIKLYKIFNKHRDLKDENEEQKMLLAQHDELLSDIKDELVKINGSIHNDILAEHDILLNEIKDELSKINDSMEEQKEVNLGQLRYSITHVCEKALKDGQISAVKLKGLEGMFEQYVNVFHANGYVRTMMTKVRELPVIGTVEE